MPYGDPFNPATPAGTDPVGEGAARIRETKAALIERLGSIFEDFPDGDPITLKIVGPLAERPTASKGAVYYAEDVNRLFVADSTPEWREPVPAATPSSALKFSKRDAIGTQLLSATARQVVEFPVPVLDEGNFWDDANNQYVINEAGLYEIAAFLFIHIDAATDATARRYQLHADLEIAHEGSSYALFMPPARDYKYVEMAGSAEEFWSLAMRTQVRVFAGQTRRFRVAMESLRGWGPPFATVGIYIGSWFTALKLGA
jgi:hypothetical protein